MYEQLLARELEILADAEELLELASAGDSEKFNSLRDRYLQRIEELKFFRTAVEVNNEQRDVLLELALALVRLDARIRRIVDPGLNRADKWLTAGVRPGQTKTEKTKPLGA